MRASSIFNGTTASPPRFLLPQVSSYTDELLLQIRHNRFMQHIFENFSPPPSKNDEEDCHSVFKVAN
jgi:hypothetical protein